MKYTSIILILLLSGPVVANGCKNDNPKDPASPGVNAENYNCLLKTLSELENKYEKLNESVGSKMERGEANTIHMSGFIDAKTDSSKQKGKGFKVTRINKGQYNVQYDNAIDFESSVLITFDEGRGGTSNPIYARVISAGRHGFVVEAIHSKSGEKAHAGFSFIVVRI